MQYKNKILVNTRLLLEDKLEGIGLYTYNILKILVKTHPDYKFYFVFDRPYSKKFVFGNNVEPIILSPPTRHPILWMIWFGFRLEKLAQKLDVDLLLSPDGYNIISKKVKTITVIHDICFEYFNDHNSYFATKYLKYFTPKVCENSNKIITVSHNSKKDLINLYNTDESKIEIAYNAPNSLFKPLSNEVKKDFKAKNTNGLDYFVYVGSIHPRKNVISILHAFEEFCNTNLEVKLVIIGRKAWKYDKEERFLNNSAIKDRIIYLPHQSQENLTKWVGAALAMVYISLYEGFGVPIIEAMSCKTPVICSDNSSMTEIAKSYGILVDPLDISEICSKFIYVINNQTEVDKMTEKASLYVQKFNWNDSADVVWNCIIDILD